MIRPHPNVHTIPAGMPFLPTLADAILDGRLVQLDRADPMALADVTVLLPTRRAVRAFGDILLDRLGQDAAILPSIRPIGDVDEDEHILDAADVDIELMPQGISPLERHLALTRLTLQWASAVRRDVLGLEEGSELAIPASAADAWRLASELARMIDEMEIAGIGWEAIGSVAPDDHARYFQITLDFLRIISEWWPAHLADIDRADPAARRDKLLRAEAQRIAEGRSSGATIAAGSTGSVPATAELLKAIAFSSNGAVVLPGLDRGGAVGLDDLGWASVDDLDAAGPAAYGHPQFGLKRLTAHIGADRSDVGLLGGPDIAKSARERLIHEALRPSDTTDAWQSRTPDDETRRRALEGVALALCANEQQEAVAIAVAMREAVETPGRTAALVTPDRGLARRAAAELKRWGLDIDDSAGSSLDREPAGVFARLVTLAADADPGAIGLLSFLRHPLASFDLPFGERMRAVETLERALMRGARFTGAVDTIPDVLRDLAEAADSNRDALTHAQRRLAPERLREAANFAERLAVALRPLRDLHGHDQVSVAGAATALAQVLEATTGGELWETVSGASLATLLTRLMEGEQAHALTIPPSSLPDFFTAVAAETAMPREPGADPRLHIWGTLEARLQSVDLLILGGLDESVWPAQIGTDPWLSRAMRAEIGLPPPELRLGLSAHDFAQGFANPQVLCTRAEKRGGAPTVENRWLQRLRTVAGDAIKETEAAGQRLVGLARALDRPDPSVEPVNRPNPCPALADRPTRLRITEVETLIRDPYAIYARHVLGLEALDPIDDMRDRALRGTLFHDALGTFIQQWRGPFDESAIAELNRLAEEALSRIEDTPELHTIWSSRFREVADWFVGWEARRDDEVETRHAEINGELPIESGGGTITLRGRADRIDLLRNGKLGIYDFKTGSPPSEKKVFAGLAPQMTLEAAMAREGAFDPSFAGREIGELLWLAIGRIGRDKVQATVGKDPSQLASDAMDMMRGLVARYAVLENGYLSRSRPVAERPGRFKSDYDHLARVQEWSLQESDEDYL